MAGALGVHQKASLCTLPSMSGACGTSQLLHETAQKHVAPKATGPAMPGRSPFRSPGLPGAYSGLQRPQPAGHGQAVAAGKP